MTPISRETIMRAIAFRRILPVLALVGLFPASSIAAEYIFRDLMANTLPSAKCSTKDEAVAKATDQYTVDKFKKRFCEVQGYGWNLAEEKSDGKLVCDECSGDANAGKFQCHMEDVVVSCKRLKPGSVGLIPGKG